MNKYAILINKNSSANRMYTIISGCLGIHNACRIKSIVIFKVIFISTYLINPVFAQSEQKPYKLTKLYMGLGPAIPSKSVGLSLTFILANNWGVSLSSKGYNLDANNLPSNYVPGGGVTYTGFFGIQHTTDINEIPKDNLAMFSFMLLREFEISAHRLRFGLEAGPCTMQYERANFTPKPNYQIGDDNYDVSYSQFHTAGFSMRAKVEIPYWRCFGMEVAVLGNINKYQSFAGAELYFNIGKVREKIPPQNVQGSINDHR